jgi:hypothetical protein
MARSRCEFRKLLLDRKDHDMILIGMNADVSQLRSVRYEVSFGLESNCSHKAIADPKAQFISLR